MHSAAVGDWVHVRSGPYKDDLARVLDLEFSSGRVTVQVCLRSH